MKNLFLLLSIHLFFFSCIEVEKEFEVGSVYKGKVQNLTQFGAFVELKEGIDGLVHVSDLSWT